MHKHSIRYTQQAVDDIDVIFDYIALDNHDAALKMLEEFENCISRLAQTPYIGAAIRTDEQAIITPGYRYMVVSPYMVFYRVADGEARIGRILHSKQDWLQSLFGRN